LVEVVNMTRKPLYTSTSEMSVPLIKIQTPEVEPIIFDTRRVVEASPRIKPKQKEPPPKSDGEGSGI
jgi:hypothetical protein